MKYLEMTQEILGNWDENQISATDAIWCATELTFVLLHMIGMDKEPA